MPIWRPPTPGVLGMRSGSGQQHALMASAPGAAFNFNQAPPQAPAGLITALNNLDPSAQHQGGGNWILDTGASSHMVNNSGILSSSHKPTYPSSIIVGNGAPIPVHCIISTSIPTSTASLKLNTIMISPHLIKNLIYVQALTTDNFVSVTFDPFGFSIKDCRTGMVLLRCDSTGDLYPLRPSTTKKSSARSFLANHNSGLWHARLGHPGYGQLQRVLNTFDFHFSKSDTHTCSACRLGKHVRLPFNNSSSIALFPFQLLHCDVWTSPIVSNSGFKFYLIILDDFSHFAWSFPLRHKSDVLPMLISFHAFVLTQFQCPIVSIQTDNGKEFDNNAARSFFTSHGIVLRLTCPYTS